MNQVQKIYNFSGHPVSYEVYKELEKFYKREIEEIVVRHHISRRMPVYPQLVDILQKNNIKVNSGEQIQMIPPGLTITAMFLCAIFHGLTGIFPEVIELLRDHRTQKYTPSFITDLEIIRQISRKGEDFKGIFIYGRQEIYREAKAVHKEL